MKTLKMKKPSTLKSGKCIIVFDSDLIDRQLLFIN